MCTKLGQYNIAKIFYDGVNEIVMQLPVGERSERPLKASFMFPIFRFHWLNSTGNICEDFGLRLLSRRCIRISLTPS